MKHIAAAVFAILALSTGAWAHSGGTDKFGCHYDHKTGFYHCH